MPKSMVRPPAFQFYVKDWLTSRKIARMTLSQVGAYSLLLAHCWDSDDCSLPDDEAALATLSRMGKLWFTAASKPLKECFVSHPKTKGALTNKRLYSEWRALWIFRNERRKAGKAGGVKSGIARKHKGIEANVKQTPSNEEAQLHSKHSLGFASSKREAKRSSSSSSSSSSSIKRTPLSSPLSEGSESGTRKGLTRLSEGLKTLFKDKLLNPDDGDTLDALKELPT